MNDIVVFDIQKLTGWKNIMILVVQYLDFRDLLKLKIANRLFNDIVDSEIDRRNKYIKNMTKNGHIISSLKFWYMGRRCPGFQPPPHTKIKCDLWEEILELGYNTKCRKCRLKEIEMNRRYAQNLQEALSGFHTNMYKKKSKGPKKFLSKNHNW